MSTQAKVAGHTPGPWKFDRTNDGKCPFFGWGIIPADYTEPSPAFVPYDSFTHTRENYGKIAEANARLIAAAPELLAALEASERELTAYTLLGRTIVDSRPTGDWNRLSRAIIAARDAIAKAEGRTP